MNALARPRRGRMFAGVCAGIAARFGWDVTIVRILAVAAVVVLGLSLWAYIILWVIMPNERV